mgnify:CR=1 FL=1
MKTTNKSITSVKKPGSKVLNKSTTLVKEGKTAVNKSNTKVGKIKSNKSTTLVGKAKKQGSDKKPTKVLKEADPVLNKSNTKVGAQENKGLNESVTFVESKELQLFKNPNNFKAFEEILNMKSKMAEVIDWYEKKQKNVIEIPELKINARALHGNLILKTYKLYESAIKKITDFIEKHPQFKQQDIISQALIEFAEKYH